MTVSADSWLKTLTDKSIVEQLLERRIVEVKPTISVSIAGYMSLKTNGNFSVSLNILSLDAEDIALTLGHEIAHTFSYDITRKIPTDLTPGIRRKLNETDRAKQGMVNKDMYYRIEHFCEEFGKKWIETMNNKEDVLRRLNCVWGISQGVRDKSKRIFTDEEGVPLF